MNNTMIETVVVLTGRDTVEARSSAGIPGPWATSEGETIALLAQGMGTKVDAYEVEARKGSTLFLRYTGE